MVGIGLFRILAFAAGLAAVATSALADAGHSHGATIGESAKASAATRTVRITLGDSFYEPKAIQVKAGETVRFVLTNTGELLHEFNIGTAAMHAEHQQEMMRMVESGMLTATGINTETSKMDHSRMDAHSMKHDDPNSVLVEPGKTRQLVWKFTTPADIEFACNLPGHYQAGMVGAIRFGR